MSEHLLQRLTGAGDAKPGVAVDAPAEAARLKDLAAKGEAPNTSATPVIEREKSGWLGF